MLPISKVSVLMVLNVKVICTAFPNLLLGQLSFDRIYIYAYFYHKKIESNFIAFMFMYTQRKKKSDSFCRNPWGYPWLSMSQ